MSYIIKLKLKDNLEKIPNIFPYYYQNVEETTFLTKKKFCRTKNKFCVLLNAATKPETHPKIRIFHKDRPNIDQE